MSERIDSPEAAPTAKRGEAAWKAAMESVAARNDQARKAGKQERRAREQRAIEHRRKMDLLERAKLGQRDA